MSSEATIYTKLVTSSGNLRGGALGKVSDRGCRVYFLDARTFHLHLNVCILISTSILTGCGCQRVIKLDDFVMKLNGDNVASFPRFDTFLVQGSWTPLPSSLPWRRACGGGRLLSSQPLLLELPRWCGGCGLGIHSRDASEGNPCARPLVST